MCFVVLHRASCLHYPDDPGGAPRSVAAADIFANPGQMVIACAAGWSIVPAAAFLAGRDRHRDSRRSPGGRCSMWQGRRELHRLSGALRRIQRTDDQDVVLTSRLVAGAVPRILRQSISIGSR